MNLDTSTGVSPSQPLAPQSAAAPLTTSAGNGNGVRDQYDFLKADAHSALAETLGDLLRGGAKLTGYIAADTEQRIISRLGDLPPDPQNYARLIDSALVDLSSGRNGHQMLRYVLNAVYQDQGLYRDQAVQDAMLKGLLAPEVTDPLTKRKFLACYEESFTPGQLAQVLRDPAFSPGAKYEMVVCNCDNPRGREFSPVITAYLNEKGSDPVAVAFIRAALRNNFRELGELEIQPGALKHLAKTFGIEPGTPDFQAQVLGAVATFTPDPSKPEDVAKAIKVLQGAVAALRADPINGPAVYEVAIARTFTHLAESKDDVWLQDPIQRQLAKSLKALADMGSLTRDPLPFINTLTWAEGVFTEPQVRALLRTNIDPTVMDELLKAGNIDIAARPTHRRAVSDFVATVDREGARAPTNRSASAEIARRAMAA